MPHCYQLVGVPAAGKTTWVKNQTWASQCEYVSTDAYIEEYARLWNKTYSDVFQEHMPAAIERMMYDVGRARASGRDIIWDQTSTTVASRRRKFVALPEYEHTAVIFATPDPLELIIRLKNRPGKIIPQRVINSMIDHFEMPTPSEGFVRVCFSTEF
jgi:predicted kinase